MGIAVAPRRAVGVVVAADARAAIARLSCVTGARVATGTIHIVVRAAAGAREGYRRGVVAVARAGHGAPGGASRAVGGGWRVDRGVGAIGVDSVAVAAAGAAAIGGLARRAVGCPRLWGAGAHVIGDVARRAGVGAGGVAADARHAKAVVAAVCGRAALATGAAGEGDFQCMVGADGVDGVGAAAHLTQHVGAIVRKGGERVAGPRCYCAGGAGAAAGGGGAGQGAHPGGHACAQIVAGVEHAGGVEIAVERAALIQCIALVIAARKHRAYIRLRPQGKRRSGGEGIAAVRAIVVGVAGNGCGKSGYSAGASASHRHLRGVEGVTNGGSDDAQVVGGIDVYDVVEVLGEHRCGRQYFWPGSRTNSARERVGDGATRHGIACHAVAPRGRVSSAARSLRAVRAQARAVARWRARPGDVVHQTWQRQIEILIVAVKCVVAEGHDVVDGVAVTECGIR